jgi:hypothetical protein
MKTKPNCILCRWSLFSENKSYILCGAQGNCFADHVYNNRHCKKLYEVKK